MKISTQVIAPLFIVRFSKISIALYEVIWFGKFQHDKIKPKKNLPSLIDQIMCTLSLYEWLCMM
jgi:hypothetical protein